MKKCIIDLTKIETLEELHREFAAQLDFPEWYGGNYDALYDMLCSIGEKTEISITGLELVGVNHFAYSLENVVFETSENNENLDYILQF